MSSEAIVFLITFPIATLGGALACYRFFRPDLLKAERQLAWDALHEVMVSRLKYESNQAWDIIRIWRANRYADARTVNRLG